MVGNTRKNELRALFGGGLSPATTPPAAPEIKAAPPEPVPETPAAAPRAASGAVKAMGLSLGAITREAEEARALRQALTDGERVVQIDPTRIEASFIEDRLDLAGQDDEDFAALVESMRESGQQVPVLLRLHPQKDGFYQTAYGHRRIKAAARLGIPVKAIVRPLSDDELVLAQGKENAERRNLSFIERALFAKLLGQRGFDRKVIGEALAVQKSELSRLLQVVESVPEQFIRAIGPAPKAGRDRWMKLGELLSSEAGRMKAAEEIDFERFKTVGSDQRFQLVFNRLAAKPKPPAEKPEELLDGKGGVFARLRRDGKVTRIEFMASADPAFIEEAAAILEREYKTFKAGRKSG